jgi:hypothetical protein
MADVLALLHRQPSLAQINAMRSVHPAATKFGLTT